MIELKKQVGYLDKREIGKYFGRKQ